MVVVFLTVHYKHVQPSPFAEMSLQHVYFCLLGVSWFLCIIFVKIACKTQLMEERKEGGFILAHSVKVYPIVVRKAGQQEGETAASCSHHTYSQEAERSTCWYSDHFFLFIQFRTPVHAHVKDESSYVNKYNGKHPSQMCPEAPFLGDSRSWQVHNEYKPTQRGWQKILKVVIIILQRLLPNCAVVKKENVRKNSKKIKGCS